MIVTVHDPLAEPMIHRDFPGGFEELEEYVMEVCEGIKDHLRPRSERSGRHALGIHLSSAALQLPSADAAADRPDRAALPAIGRDALHPPGAGDHVESLGRSKLLRSGVPAKRLVPDHRAGRPAGVEHEHPLPLERRLQSGVHEHVRAGPAAIDSSPGGLPSFPAAKSVSAATATWPTVFIFTARILNEFEKRFLGAVEKRTFAERTMRYEDVRDMMESARPAILEKARKMGRQT